jgi:hypothetical protein
MRVRRRTPEHEGELALALRAPACMPAAEAQFVRRTSRRSRSWPCLRQGAPGGPSQTRGISAHFAPSPGRLPYVASKHPKHEL